MATEANIPEDESASRKTVMGEGYSMTENKSSMELSTSHKSPTEYICKSEHCQVDKIENQTFTKICEDERQQQTGEQSKDVETGGDRVEAINDIDMEESDHAEKDGAKISRQACAEEPMTDQYESSKVIAESTQKEMITSQTNENTRSKGEEEAGLECSEQRTNISETNLGLIHEASLPNLDLTTKSQGGEDERVEESCTKDEDRNPTIHVEDEVKEISLDGVQKKKEDMPSLLEGERKGPDSIGSCDKLEQENNTEDVATINVKKSTFEASSKTGDNVDDKLENPYSDPVTEGVSTQVAIEERETLQEVSSTICRDKSKDIHEINRINLENHNEEKRDSQQKNKQEDQLREQVINAEKTVEPNMLPVEEFKETTEKDESISMPDGGETSISTKKIPPLADSITKIRGEETIFPEKIANHFHENTRSKGEEDADLECNKQSTSISETNLGLTNEDSHPNIDWTTKSQGEEDERVEESSTKDEDRDSTTYVEDEVEEISMDGVQKKKEAVPSLLEGECKDPESMGSSDKLEHENNTEEDASRVNVEESTFEAASEIGDNVNDKLENPYSGQVTDAASSQLAIEVGEGPQEVSSAVSRDESKDIYEAMRINLEMQDEEKRDSQKENDPADQPGEQVILIPEESEIAASTENVEKRVKQNTLPVEKFEEQGEKDEPTSTLDSGETSISIEKIPPLAESITEIRGEETMFLEKIANDFHENTRPNGEEDSDLECNEQPTSISETNLGLTSEASLPNLDSTTKSQVDEDERVEESSTKDEDRDSTTHVEDEVEEISMDGVQKKKEAMPSLLEGECKDPESMGSSNKLEHENNTEEDASRINVEESTFEAASEIGDNVNDKLENPYSGQVTDAASSQLAIEVGEGPQEVSSAVSRDESKDIYEAMRINLEMHDEEKRDSQKENDPADQPGEQVILIPEESEIAASTENVEKRVKQNTLPVEKFEEQGEKDEPTSTPDSGETSISIEKIPPLAESITEIRGEETMFPEKIANDFHENTRPNGEEDSDLECNEQPTSISETNLGLTSEASLPNLDSTTKSQVDEDERVEESSTKDEDRDSTTHVEDEVEEISMDGVQKKKEAMPSLLEGECKDPESMGSSNKLEHENNTEEDASRVNVEESTFEAASEIGDNVNDKLENPYSGQVTDAASSQLAIEVGEGPQEVSSAVSRDESKDIYEAMRINLEMHDEEKRDSQKENDPADQPGEQVILIPEESEIAASTENVEKRVKQNTLPVEKFEEQGEKDEPTSTPNSGETSISIEKIPPLAESSKKIRGEETMSPLKIANDLNSKDPSVEETGQPDSGETGEVPKTETQEKHQESSRFCPENNDQDEHLSETHSTENLVVKHMGSEAMVTTETKTKSTKDTEELQKVTDSHLEDKTDIKSDEKIITEETKVGEEAIDKQLLATKSVSEDEDPSRIPTTAFARNETTEQSFHEESLKDGESTLIEKNESQRPENGAEEHKNAAEASDLLNNRGGLDFCKQQIVKGSVEETLNKFQDKEKEIQNLRDDPPEEIKGENHVSNIPPEFIQQNTGLEEGCSTATQLYSNPNECSSAESKSSAESSSSDKSPTENICESEHQILTKPENERQHQKGLQNEDLQISGDTAEAHIQEASYAASQDNNQDICEAVRREIDAPPVDGMAKAEDLACANRDLTEHEEDIIQTGPRETDEDSKINPETHDGEKRDLWHKAREQAHLIHPAEDFDMKEALTYAPNTRETSISTEKSLSRVESITEINNEEMISPQQIANGLNINDPSAKETGQLDSGGTEVSKTDAPEEHQESSKFCAENNKQDEHHPETQSTENLIIRHVDPMVTTEMVSESTKDIEEIEKVPLSYTEEKIDVEEDEKIIPEQPTEMEEATDKKLHETAKESISEDQTPSRLPTTTLITDETTESIKEESLKESESTLIEKNECHRAESDAEEKIKADEESDLPKATGNDIYEQQIVEGSVEGTMDKFQDQEKEIEDTSREKKGENYDPGLPAEFNQNSELQERYLTTAQLESNPNKCSQAEFESSGESSSLEKSLTEKIFEPEHFQANEVEAVNDIDIEEPDHDKEHDGAKSSMLASIEKPNLKVHEEETSIDNSNLDQHLEVLTDQHASFEVIPESIEKEMMTSQTNENTISKREKDADLECNEQVTSTCEITLGKINEVSLPNLALATTNKDEEDESAIESFTKDEDIETTKHVEDELKDLSLTGIQNKKAEMAFVPEDERKDPESIGSSSKLEHENNRELEASKINVAQIPYVHSVEESAFEASSNNGDNNEDKNENPSSNLVTDGATTQVAIEAGETLQEASNTACKDKSIDACESVWPEKDVPPVKRMTEVEDSAYQDRDARGANEEDINQAGLTETTEDSRINPDTHDSEMRDSLQKNDQDYELGEQAVLIPEKTQTEAPRENAEKIVEQNIHSVEKFEEQEKDEPTSTPYSGETLISTEKSLQLAEFTTKTENEETIFPQKITNDLNTKDPLVEDPGKLDIGETGKESQTGAQEQFEDLSKLCTENDKQDENSEVQNTENLVIKHMDSEAMVTTKTITKSTEDTQELDRVPESHLQEKIDIKGDEKIISEEPKETKEATDKQLNQIAKESVSEDESLSKLPRTASVGDERIEQSFHEESPTDGASITEKNESYIPENDAAKDKKVFEMLDPSETTGRQGINEKQVIEESVEETINNFQDNEKKIQILREDTRKEIEEKSSVSGLPSEFIQTLNALQQGITDETILCKSDQNVENSEIVTGMSSKKEEQVSLEEHANPSPKEASIEDQDEHAYSMDIAKDKAQASRQNLERNTCTEGEETAVKLETFSQREKMEEEPKDIDNGKENKASYQEVCEPSETEVSALKQEEIENTVGTLSSSTVEMNTRKEYLEKDESDETKIKEEVKVTELKGQIEATPSIERKISSPSDDFSEPKEDADILTIEENNTLIKGPSSISGVPRKDSSSTNNSETEFQRFVSENAAMKEAKPVDEDHLEGPDAAHEMMDLTISETKSNRLCGDIAERQEGETNSEENRDMEVKEVVDQGEQIYYDIRDKDLIIGINHEKELTIADDRSGHTVIDSSMLPSYGEPKTVEMSKMTENTPAREDILYVETKTPLLTQTEGASMLVSSDNEKEHSNEGIQKHKDGDQPMPPKLKTENIILESDTGDIVNEKREQADSLADQNEVHKLVIVEDEKSTIEVTKTLLHEEELTEKTEDTLAVTTGKQEAAELQTASSSCQEEYLNAKTSELLMEKDDSVADQSEEILLHSSNNQKEGKDNILQDQDSQSIQEVIGLQFEGDAESNLKARCDDEDLLNSSLDQDGNVNAIKLTQEVYQRSGTTDNNENIGEHPTEGRITSAGEETENEVEVPTSKLTEQIQSTKSTEGKKSATLEDQTEQTTEITDFSASKSTDASETTTEDSSSTSKVSEKENEAGFIKKDDFATDDSKNVPVIVEIEETGLKNARRGHEEHDKGSVIVSENEGETAITTDKATSDSIDTVGREEENFDSQKKEILEGLNESHLKMGSCAEETDKTTAVQREREPAISTIPMSQDYPPLLEEERDDTGDVKIHPTDAKSTREEIADKTAETHLVPSTENTLPEKEQEVVKPGGVSDLESVNITKECSNEDSPQLKNEVNEENLLVEASKCATTSTHEDSQTMQGQDFVDTTFEGSLTDVAIEKVETALENDSSDALPPTKTVEAADTNEKVELASESAAEDQSDEKIYQAKEKSNSEDNVFESRENIPNKKIQGEAQRVDVQFEVAHHMSLPGNADEATVVGGTENVPAATEKANGSENIIEHSPEPTSNLKESDTLSAAYETFNEARATKSEFLEHAEKLDLVEERESRISENPAKANEDFNSLITTEALEEGLDKEECEEILFIKSSTGSQGVEKDNKAEISNKEDDTSTSETLPYMPERKDLTNIDKVKINLDIIYTDNKQEKSFSSEDRRDKQSQEIVDEGGREMGQDTRDKAPTTGDEQSAIEFPIKNTNPSQTVSDEDQHEVKSEATEKGEYENIKDNLLDDKEGTNVTEAATKLTCENRDIEPKITGIKTEVMAEGEKDQGLEASGTAEVSEYARDIQQLEESSLEAVDKKFTVKADAETRETNEDTEQGLRDPDRETMPEVQPQNAKSINTRVEGTQVEKENISSSKEEPLQAATHLDEATDTAAKAQKAETRRCEEAKVDSEKHEGAYENQTMEPLLPGSSTMVEASQDREAKVGHKKSHNILSGVGSKVKHSISKVKKAITGKPSHPKTPSPK